jgi:hypothetical protein
MNNNNVISQLRIFFGISNAVFEFQQTITSVFNRNAQPSPMAILHRLALKEVQKENPDLKYIDRLLAEMEILAEENRNKKNNE